MTQLLVYPDTAPAYPLDKGTWAKVSATPDTFPGAVDDPADDTEYAHMTAITSGEVINGYKVWQFDLSTLPASSVINRVRINWATWRNSWGEFRVRLGATNTGTGGIHYGPDEAFQRPYPLSTKFTYSTAWRSTDNNGVTWDEHFNTDSEEILAIVDHRYNDSDGRLYYLQLEVEYQAPPTVTVGATPSTGTALPVIKWSFTGEFGQSAYRVKIFDDATYGGGGFDADTSTPTYDSGKVASVQAREHLTDDPIPDNDTYKAYVKGWDNNGQETVWDDGTAWTTNYTPPADLTSISGTFDTDAGAVDLTIVGFTEDYMLIERTADAGTTWVRLNSTLAAASWTDASAPLNATLKYRAKQVETANGLLSDTWKETSNVSTTTSNFYMKCPAQPSLSSKVSVVSLRKAARQPSLIVENASGGNPAVVTGGYRGDRLNMRFRTITSAEHSTLMALLTSGEVLLLQSVIGESWYVKPTSDFDAELVRAAPTSTETSPIRHFYEIDVEFVETDYTPS